MSNISDLFNAIGLLKDSTSIAIAGGVIGTLADLSGGLGIDVIGELFPKDDELKQALDVIQADFSQLAVQIEQVEGQIAASDKLQRMRDIDQGINPAVGVFEQIPANLSSTPPVSQDFKQSQIQMCLDTVLFFTDYDDKWQVNWADLPYYSDAWSETLAPQAGGDGLVFNYTYTLPQFLRAIYIFLTTVRALEPTSITSYQPVLNKCLQRLETIHETIVSSGIVGTKMPADEGFGYVDEWLCGAVEVYSATSIVESYNFPYDVVDLGRWSAQERTNFFNLLQLRILRQKKALYSQIGMPVVRQVINQLRKLTGQPLLTDVPYEAWTVGEVFSTLGIPLPTGIGAARSGLAEHLSSIKPALEPTETGAARSGLAVDLSGVESALATFLKETPPYIATWVISSDDIDFKSNQVNHPVIVPAKPLPKGSLYTFLTGASVEPIMKQA